MTEQTYPVTVRLTKDNLISLQNDLLKRKDWLNEELDKVYSDLDTIGQALTRVGLGPQSVNIQSESDPDAYYNVRVDIQGAKSCSCPAFQFGSGLDSQNRCKHIRTALAQGRIR
jgi:hypothetical protein